MLKIAIVTNNYKPYSGGVVSSIDSFVETLKILGHKPFIITLDFNGQNYNEEQNVFRIKCPIKFIYKNNPMGIPFRANWEIYNIIKNLAPNIIHSQHPFLLGISALKTCRKLNLPIIFTYHTRYEEYLHYLPLPEILTGPIVKKLAISYCNQIDGIIAPSESIYQFLKNNNVNKQITVISSGILPVFNLTKFKNKEKSKPFKLLTVSRFVQEKNIPFLLNVFKKLDNENFVFNLIGYGSDLASLKSYAYQKLNLSKNQVQFIEKPEKEIIAQYYKNSDLFIFSSVTETQGLVLAESMAAATPIVALNSHATNEIIKNGKNGFIINSEEEMAQKINLIFKDENLHNQMQHEAWQFAQNYNPLNTTNSLIDFYNHIIQNKINSF